MEVVDGVADAVENQAEAGRDATIADRFKMAAGDSAGMVSDNVDNPYVSVRAVSIAVESGVVLLCINCVTS